jgi:hypothetical protein
MSRLRFRFRSLRHPLSLFGVWLTTVSAVLFLVVFVAELLGMETNPYIGIIFFLVLPGLFVLGLLLITRRHVWLMRRRERLGRPTGIEWPVVDLNAPHTRFIVFAVAAATIVNIVVISLAAYRGVEYMDSVEFCGQVCHTVMEPEFTAYQHGPHAAWRASRATSARGAVVREVEALRHPAAVRRGPHTYPTPIPSPVENLRPARDTCEQCHWPEKFTGDRIRQVYEYADDEANTEDVTTLRLHVGSGQQRLGAVGIHWHMSPSVRVSYITTDPKRQVIPWVQVEDGRGGRTRLPGRGRERRGTGPGGAAGDGLHGLPQPAEPSLRSPPENAVTEAMRTARSPRTCRSSPRGG